MSRHGFDSARVPRPGGPYSSGVSAGHLVIISAQLPLTAEGAPIDGSAAEQARRCLDDLAHQLRSQGLGLDSVAELVVYAVAEEDVTAIDAAVAEYFDEPRPARTVVGVAWVPHGARLQVGALAIRY
ncbi:MAG: Rid family hydrolase [Thermoleophilia bacterium]|jgi:2-iminobutanoate/2-iminopropanoate deaminase|nr:Rid family hydrolase [Thermoleophilia bacterium]